LLLVFRHSAKLCHGAEKGIQRAIGGLAVVGDGGPEALIAADRGTGGELYPLLRHLSSGKSSGKELGVQSHGRMAQSQVEKGERYYGTENTRERPNDGGNPPSNTK